MQKETQLKLRKIFKKAHVIPKEDGIPSKTKVSRVSLSRKGQAIGEYEPRELPSLLETGFLQEDDLCLEPKTTKLVPLWRFLRGECAPGYPNKKAEIPSTDPANPTAPRRGNNKSRRVRVFRLITLASLTGAAVAIVWAMTMSAVAWNLRSSLGKERAANSEWEKKYQNVLFAAREVADSGQVRGRVIVRDASGTRVSLPGIKVRLYRRTQLETYLADRYAKIAEVGGTDPTRLATHFLKNIPNALEVVSTNSDGRFEFKIPEPGEYVIQTSIRAAKSGAIRLWFVTFDSRDPLNTAVDLTESNAVQQFNPLFMLVEGR